VGESPPTTTKPMAMATAITAEAVRCAIVRGFLVTLPGPPMMLSTVFGAHGPAAQAHSNKTVELSDPCGYAQHNV
jgi:hypothetical protein